MLGVRERIQPSCSKHLLGTYQGEKEIPMRLHMPRDCAWQRRQEAQDEAVRKWEIMREKLKKWERRIDDLLRDRGFTVCGLPDGYTEDDRVWAANELRHSSMLTMDYIVRLRAIISIMEYALSSANGRIDALLDIIKHSSINCNHCMNARSIEQKDRCIEIDYDCVICKEAGCPCQNCKDGQNFVWHIVPGQTPPNYGQMQRPIELYQDRVPLGNAVRTIPILIEHRFTKEIVGGLYDVSVDMFFFPDEDGGRWLDNEGQGRTWRAWLVYPTQKERDTAPWKELLDEGFTEEELHEIT